MTTGNFGNVSSQGVVLSLVALGQFLVVLTGGVDLSLGMVVKISSLTTAITIGGYNERTVPAALLAVVLGLAIGAGNGIIVNRFRVPAFIATLGTLAVVQGIALSIASTPQGETSPLLSDVWSAQIGPLYLPVVLTAIVWLVVAFALHRTVWGRHLYATGGDPNVARVSGVRTSLVSFSVFVIAGGLSALAGIWTAARAGIGDPNAGFGLEFESLAAVVIGGASLAGGRGRVLGVLGGVVLLSLIGNVFNLLGVEVWYQQLIKGAIILVGAAAYAKRV
jgi:ribose transport system permease protein